MISPLLHVQFYVCISSFQSEYFTFLDSIYSWRADCNFTLFFLSLQEYVVFLAEAEYSYFSANFRLKLNSILVNILRL